MGRRDDKESLKQRISKGITLGYWWIGQSEDIKSG